MGHNRLQYPPDTARWLPVVESVADGADVAIVAGATIEAANKGLELAKSDKGLQHAVWLLSHLAIAAREPNFSSALAECDVKLPQSATALDVVAAFSDAMDRHLAATRSRTDIGEMAQMAAAESLAHLVGRESAGLFGSSSEATQAAIRSFSTKSGFSDLAHSFFARFTERYLGYHLTRHAEPLPTCPICHRPLAEDGTPIDGHYKRLILDRGDVV